MLLSGKTRVKGVFDKHRRNKSGTLSTEPLKIPSSVKYFGCQKFHRLYSFVG